MNIVLQNHNYRYAIEQTLMALLPYDQLFPDTAPQNSQRKKMEELLKTKAPTHGKKKVPVPNLLLSSLENLGEGQFRADTILNWKGKQYRASIPCGNSNPEQQYALKTSVYQAVAMTLKHKAPWGSLSGVRPVKLATKLLQQGENVAEVLREKYDVEESRAKLAEDCAKIAQPLIETHQGKTSVYVGIPFCPSRCDYCSFFSQTVVEDGSIEDYVNCLVEEISSVPRQPIHCLYLGGGTPTVLSPEQLHKVLSALKERFSKIEELTVEAGRPETLTKEKIAVLLHHGVSRISINPQTMTDSVLKDIGRDHSVKDIHSAYAMVQGKFTVNMDLIAGLSTEADYLQSLEAVIAMNPEQITVHSLTSKKNTPRTEKSSTQYDKAPPHSWVATMDKSWIRLAQAGYTPYYLYRQKQITQGLENIGWTKTEPCLYNLAMMEEFENILAFGSGAVSKSVNPEETENKAIQRVQNPKFPHDYQRELPHLIEKKNALFCK